MGRKRDELYRKWRRLTGNFGLVLNLAFALLKHSLNSWLSMISWGWVIYYKGKFLRFTFSFCIQKLGCTSLCKDSGMQEQRLSWVIFSLV
jgi:hypothetical protein